MDYRKFVFKSDRYLILRKQVRFTRTESGKSWKSKPDEITQEVITSEQYTNYIQWIPEMHHFFNTDATCKAKHNYTCAGYLPITVTSISPGHDTKIIAEFEFINKEELFENAGFRERDIIERAKTYNYEWDKNRGDLWEFVTEPEKDGHCDSATYQQYGHKWVN